MIYKMFVALILGGIAGAFIATGNFIIPLISLIIASVILFFLNKNVEEVLTDERINSIAGRASKIIFVVSTFIMALAGMILVSIREKYPELLITGYILACFACGMMLLYSILFRYYSKQT